MEGTRLSLWLFLLLNQLPFSPTDADQDLSTAKPYTYNRNRDGGSSSPTVELGLSDHTNYPDTDANGPRIDCLIDTEMGLIAIGSAGGLIVCLLVIIVILTCQICHIQRRAHALRTSQSNLNLARGSGCWGTDRPEIQGLVGPCDTSVMLEEVRADGKMEEDGEAEKWEEREEAGAEVGAEPEEGATAMAFDLRETFHVPTSSSRDSLVQRLKDIEDLPLVV